MIDKEKRDNLGEWYTQEISYAIKKNVSSCEPFEEEGLLKRVVGVPVNTSKAYKIMSGMLRRRKIPELPGDTLEKHSLITYASQGALYQNSPQILTLNINLGIKGDAQGNVPSVIFVAKDDDVYVAASTAGNVPGDIFIDRAEIDDLRDIWSLTRNPESVPHLN